MPFLTNHKGSVGIEPGTLVSVSDMLTSTFINIKNNFALMHEIYKYLTLKFNLNTVKRYFLNNKVNANRAIRLKENIINHSNISAHNITPSSGFK